MYAKLLKQIPRKFIYDINLSNNSIDRELKTELSTKRFRTIHLSKTTAKLIQSKFWNKKFLQNRVLLFRKKSIQNFIYNFSLLNQVKKKNIYTYINNSYLNFQIKQIDQFLGTCSPLSFINHFRRNGISCNIDTRISMERTCAAFLKRKSHYTQT